MLHLAHVLVLPALLRILCTPSCAAMAALAGGARAAAAGRRGLQEACVCQSCLDKGNSIADCRSFGLDCGCAHTAPPPPSPPGDCPCTACIAHNNTIADCEGYGMQCGCYTAAASKTCNVMNMQAECADARRASTGHCLVCLENHSEMHQCNDAARDQFCGSAPADVCSTVDCGHGTCHAINGHNGNWRCNCEVGWESADGMSLCASPKKVCCSRYCKQATPSTPCPCDCCHRFCFNPVCNSAC